MDIIAGVLAGERPSIGVIAISGEPGIGKSRLLAELAEAGERERMLVLDGRASDVERDVPFAVFRNALDDYLASVHPRLIRPEGTEGRAELARIFPSLAAFGAESAGLVEERWRSHHAVRELLDGLAASKPLLLLLDDLHWADEASLELLSHLLRHPPRNRVILALAFRSGGAPPGLLADLGEIARSGRVARVELAPLTDSRGSRADRGGWYGDRDRGRDPRVRGQPLLPRATGPVGTRRRRRTRGLGPDRHRRLGARDPISRRGGDRRRAPRSR